MTALPPEVAADLERRVAELEQKLQAALAERNDSVAREAAIWAETARLYSELRIARDRQNATADILRTIASVSGDAQTSLQQIAETTARLFGAPSVSIMLAQNGEWTDTFRFGSSAELVRSTIPLAAIRVGGRNLPGTVVAENRQVHIPDVDDLDPAIADWPGPPLARAAGTRTMCGTPLRRDGKAIGVLVVYRDRRAPFTDEELALQQSFADQAAIATENSRLFNETREALERQTATAEILKVIASSPSDVQPVFDAIVTSAARLIGGFSAGVYRFVDDLVHLAAFTSINPAGDEMLRASFPRPIADIQTFERVRAGEVVPITDTEAQPAQHLKDLGRARGFRSVLNVPLNSHGTSIGMIVVSRTNPGPFAAHHVELLQAFADQAVIAIENVRLFNETREALERQNATAEILRTIAGAPDDAERALYQIAETTMRLFGAPSAAIHIAEGDGWSQIIRVGESSQRVGAGVPETQLRIGGRNMPGVIVAENRQVHVPDLDNVDPAIADWPGLPFVREGGTRSMSGAPLRREGKAIGALIVYRDRLWPFSDAELSLQQSFADQAAIAIENARLINETREALERQTATAEILKVIASSPSDVQPVFDAIAASGHRLLGSYSTSVFSIVDDMLHLSASTPINPSADALLKASFPRPLSGEIWNERIRNGDTVQIPDIETDPIVPEGLREMWRQRGFRSLLLVPLVRSQTTIGMINATRAQPGSFSSHHVQLLQTFADQAVIAIENTRLFNETREALERQTATAEVLKVIASSPSDVQPVFGAIADSAKHLLGAFSTTVLRFIGDELHLVAYTPTDPAADEALRASFPRKLAEFPTFALVRNGETIQFADTEAEEVPAENRELARLRGFRSVLFTPLMNQGTPVGMISVTRAEPGAFVPHHIQLLQTFADQAVIAIENARLFNETREALERQTATAEILKVIASSSSDVQPVFDAIVNSAARLFEPCAATITTLKDGKLHWNAVAELVPSFDHAGAAAAYPIAFDPERSPSARAILERRIIEIPDTTAPGTPEFTRKVAAAGGFRNVIFVPLINDGRGIGTIILAHPKVGFKFSDKQLALLQTFADQAVIAIENVRLFNETREALERQTATAEILNVIASSPSDVQPVFEAIVESAKRLLGGFSAAVFRFIDETAYLQAITPTNPAADEIMKNSFPRPVADFQSFAMVQDGRIAQIPDTEALSDDIRDIARARGFRSMLITPLMSGGTPIGMISVTRVQVGTFPAHHEQLLQTFADQAVIAIENTRLFNETREALERQTATAEILKVIASSPSDVQPVFDAIAHSANRLIGGFSAAVFRYLGGKIHLAAFTPTDAEGDAVLQSSFPLPLAEFPPYQLTREGAPAELPDTDLEPAARDIARARGYRSMLFAPLMNDGEAVGIITVTRVAPGPFGEQHARLLQMFADQAVIAIKNVGLFNEVQARTEELSEALQQQTATADVLKVISRSAFDLETVLDALLSSACRLCEADIGTIRYREGGEFRLAATFGCPPEWIEHFRRYSTKPDRSSVFGRTIVEGHVVHIPDLLADPDYNRPEAQKLMGFRAALGVPLTREGEAFGVINLFRFNVSSFEARQIELVQTFADQAVIAIENVRLFDEVQAKTRDLEEALQQQTATSDVLKVISRSAFDLDAVMNTLSRSASELCDAEMSGLFLREGDHLIARGVSDVDPELENMVRRSPVAIDDQSYMGHSVLSGEIVNLADVEHEEQTTRSLTFQKQFGYKSVLVVPLMRDGRGVGVFALCSNRVGAFSQRQIDLVQTFADQAVIAIENVRLFDEVQARTRDLSESLQQQTATADVLKVISRSAFDLQTVLDTLVESAARLCEADMAAITRRIGDEYYRAGSYGFPPEFAKYAREIPVRPDRRTITGRTLLEGSIVHVDDVLADPEYDFEGQQLSGNPRTFLGVPLLREGTPIGALTLTRSVVRPFTDKQIELITTFADQAVIAIENVRLFDEVQAKTRDLSEALTYQTGSGNILSVIASSPTNVGPVLQAIVESACQLCAAYDAVVVLRHDSDLVLSAHHGPIPMNQTRWLSDRTSVSGRAIIDRSPVHLRDVLSDEGAEFPTAQEMSRRDGCHTILSVPMLREGEAIGTIVLRRTEAHPFSDKQIALLQTFADQAVIAIGNVRLFDEVQAKTRDLTEALTYQTGSSNILSVIASSPTDVAPVLKAIVESACELCGAYDAIVRLKDGNHLVASAHHGPIPTTTDNLPIERNSFSGRVVIDKKPVHVHDMQSTQGDEFPESQQRARRLGHRTILGVPLLREGESIGAIILRRTEAHPFGDKQIALLQTFADQAVIAIGNVRLFEEVQAKTRDLTEALTHQTGSANILKVIASSPTDIKPVLNAIVESASELCGAYDAVLRLKKGDELELGAHHGTVPADWNLSQINPYWTAGRAALEQRPVHVHDMSSSEGDEFPDAQARARDQGHRTILSVPLLQEGNSIGTLTLRRLEVNPFTDKQIALLQTFADQAVIAIGNVRLFEEVQAKTRDLSEALTYQTASSNILGVIASSPTEVEPALQAIVESACKLCDAYDASVLLKVGNDLHYSAHRGPIPIGLDKWPISRDWVTGRCVVDKVTLQIPDLRAPEAAEFPEGQEHSHLQGHRCLLAIPLLREGEAIGAIVLRRREPVAFNEKQIALLQTFADQAVIAIGNVRLFEEVQQRTRELTESLQQQTATADVLKVISASPGELEPVFQAMLENAGRLCDAKFAMLILYEKETNEFRGVGKWNLPPVYSEFLGKNAIPADPRIPLGRVAITKQPVQIADILEDQSYLERFPGIVAVAELGGARTLLQVPMLKDNELVGTIGIYRQEVRLFTDKQIALVQNFAAQAVIAIENARLLNELRQRTDDLSRSLDELRTAQGRLVQTEKLASLGQLTAGIAHEIKNPLNFVNNFAALSAELTDELNDVLKPAAIADKLRNEVDELTRLLKDNLEKVVQHGKRADSIVKNMLLHSREGSGDHRPADINALVDESLNLAYHGARAEKPDFNVTLQRDFDPAAGQIEVFPQEITRVFLNLVSNGFYAVSKRRRENGGAAFEPTLLATTKNLGDTVEIRIRDNGTGIPPEIKERMFNPFFTTKPAGEGTGLGLSMSHDIIVKQHGGTIDVDTEPGHFTEFRIVLPRTSNFSNKN